MQITSRLLFKFLLLQWKEHATYVTCILFTHKTSNFWCDSITKSIYNFYKIQYKFQ